jgi:carbon starvation protein
LLSFADAQILWILVALSGAFAVAASPCTGARPSTPCGWSWLRSACTRSAIAFYSAGSSPRSERRRRRATPALRLNNGRDFMPTHRWIVFGHHFAAIAGPAR